jgi:uncharacterized protein (DUF342 family)
VEGRIVRPGEVLEAWDGALGTGLEGDSDGRLRVVSVGVGFLEVAESGELVVSPAVRVSADRVEAALELHAPVDGEAPVERAEVEAALEAAGIAEGLDLARVDAAWRIFEARGELLRPMRVARGRAPVAGRPSRIDYDPSVVPDEPADGEDARIDYHECGGVVNVTEGQRIGVWVPGEESAPGVGVDGAELEVDASERTKPLRVGKHVDTVEGEDGRIELLAAKAGILVIADGVPGVSLVLTIDGDVDLDTGNIDAEGSVVIKGAVRPGFKVRARDGLVVFGVVEGADLAAGADMELKKGLIGSDDTKVMVAGDLRIKYAQNAHLEVRGNVELGDSDMGSTILCSGRLRADAGRGRLRGGDYHAALGLRAKELGSDLGALTRASVGTDILRERERGALSGRLDELKHERLKFKRLSGQKSGFAQRKAEKRRRELQKEEHSLRAKLAEFDAASGVIDAAPEIRIQKSVFFGVELEIRGAHLRPTETTGGRLFAFDPTSARIQARSL